MTLAGCQTKPELPIGLAVPPKMPSLPSNLAKKAYNLPPMADRSLVGAHLDGVAVDRKYNDVSEQLNTIIDAWSCVADALNNKVDPNTCFGDSN